MNFGRLVAFQYLGWQITLLGISCKEVIPKVRVSHDVCHITFWKFICSLRPTDEVWVHPLHSFQSSPIIPFDPSWSVCTRPTWASLVPHSVPRGFVASPLGNTMQAHVTISSMRKYEEWIYVRNSWLTSNETSNSFAILCAHQFGQKTSSHVSKPRLEGAGFCQDVPARPVASQPWVDLTIGLLQTVANSCYLAV